MYDNNNNDRNSWSSLYSQNGNTPENNDESEFTGEVDAFARDDDTSDTTDVNNPSDYFQPQQQRHPYEPRYTPPQPQYIQNGVYQYGNANKPPVPKKPKKGFTAGKVIALALCCSIVGGLLGAGGMAIGGKMFLKNSSSQSTEISNIFESKRTPTILNINSIDESRLMSAAEVYAANVNSTVGITTSLTTNYFGYQTTSAASGSGFIFSDNGYILTNYHVVENADTIKVTLFDDSAYEASLVGYDSSNDIAVLKIEAENLTPVIIGNSDILNVGDSVVAIGNPLGELTFSLTSGSVSALDRTVTFSNAQTMQLIQTDCAINSGNSGGALFNMYGEVIGITNAKYSSSSASNASIDNIGFAIPINSVKEIVRSIIEKGYISKPYIGVSVATVSEEAQSYGLPAGATVRAINDNSPAQEAGLLENDIIIEADGQTISSSSDLVAYIADKEIGDTVSLKIYRQGEYVEVTLTIGEQKQAAKNDEDREQEQAQQYGYNDQPFSFPFGFDFGW